MITHRDSLEVDEDQFHRMFVVTLSYEDSLLRSGHCHPDGGNNSPFPLVPTVAAVGLARPVIFLPVRIAVILPSLLLGLRPTLR